MAAPPREVMIAFLQTVGIAACALCTSSRRVILLRALAKEPLFFSFLGLCRGFAPFARFVSAVSRRRNLGAHDRGILYSSWSYAYAGSLVGNQPWAFVFWPNMWLPRVRSVGSPKVGIPLQSDCSHSICCRSSA